MSHRVIPWDWPDFVAAAIGQVGECQDERARDWVLRVYPHVLVERACTLLDAWKHVLPCVSERSRIVLSRDWADRHIRDAIALRERVAQSSFTLPVLAKWSHGMMTKTEDLEVIDWLNGLRESDPPLLGRLDRMTWAQAEERSRRWHAAMAKRKAIAAGSDGTADRVESHDGHHWVRLVSEEALDRESAAMGHCVGLGGYDRHAKLPVEQGGIWSLRDARGKSVLTAHLYLDDGMRSAANIWDHMLPVEMPVYYVEPTRLLRSKTSERRLRVGQISGPRNRGMRDDEIRHVAPLRAFYRAKEIGITPEIYRTGQTFEDRPSIKENGRVLKVKVAKVIDENGKVEECRRTDTIDAQITTVIDGKLPDPSQFTDESIAVFTHKDRGSIHHLVDGKWVKLAFKGNTEILVGQSRLLVYPQGDDDGRMKVQMIPFDDFAFLEPIYDPVSLPAWSPTYPSQKLKPVPKTTIRPLRERDIGERLDRYLNVGRAEADHLKNIKDRMQRMMETGRVDALMGRMRYRP